MLKLEAMEVALQLPHRARVRLHQWAEHSSFRMAGWYVANVSLIFDAPCLFYTNCLCFVYTLWNFYAFSGTNLLTRCHSASSCFLLFFVFQKRYTRNILGIGQNKA
jgi:hypothetical protein